MMPLRLAASLVCCFGIAACGGTTPQLGAEGQITETPVHEKLHATDVPAPATAASSSAVGIRPTSRVIERAALRALLDKGPAYVLARVELTPVYVSRRFSGFRIDRFKAQPPAYLELRPGDVIRRVNGRKVDTPESYFEIFEELKVASELRFDVVRGDRELKFSYSIVN